MDTPVFKSLRIAPTTQQGGTQTIQQAIYLTHDNPCGINLLIFQEMGLTKIRYIDLKNYLDDIVGSDEMKALFEDIRVAATAYIAKPDDAQLYRRYLYTIMMWSKRAIANLPVSVNYYTGYRFRVDVYDGSGTSYYDSFYPILEIITYDSATGLYDLSKIPIVPAQPKSSRLPNTNLYKLTSAPRNIPFIDDLNEFPLGFSALLSNFLYNQSSATETEMCVGSLLIDSANTRTFGIPKYGFSARQNISQFGGIVYNCVNFIDIRTIPDADGKTTLVESIFFRLSLNEDTYNFSMPSPLQSSASVSAGGMTEEACLQHIMEDEDMQHAIARAVNDDVDNLEENLKSIRNGQNADVCLKYYRKIMYPQEQEQVQQETNNEEEIKSKFQEFMES